MEPGTFTDRRSRRAILRFFGTNKAVEEITRLHWDRFIRLRSSGQLATGEKPGKGRPVKSRIIGYDLLFLRAVFNWAVDCKLIAENPLKGLKIPKEKNPHRPRVTQEEYEALLAVGDEIHPLFTLALLLVHETGHRQQSVCHLRWSDIDWKRGTVSWRGEFDKGGINMETPLSDLALAALKKERRRRASIGGEGWIISVDEIQPCGRTTMSRWFRDATTLAGVHLPPRSGFHSLRKKFATDLKGEAMVDIMALGGWKSERTILQCYQESDQDSMRGALERRKKHGNELPHCGNKSSNLLPHPLNPKFGKRV